MTHPTRPDAAPRLKPGGPGWSWAASSVAAALLLAGCAGGPTGYPPLVTDPANAGDVTFYRDGSWVGFPVHIHLLIDGQEVYRLWLDESYRLALDPGEYVIDFNIGFNECRDVILVEPRRTYRYRLVPNCLMESKPTGLPLPYAAPKPKSRDWEAEGPPKEGPGSTSYDLIHGD